MRRLRGQVDWLTGLAALLVGCVPVTGGWPVADLEAAYPELTRHDGHRLGDLVPYPWPREQGVVLVLCRFEATTPIDYGIEGEALTEVERGATARAVAALDEVLTTVGFVGSGLGAEATLRVRWIDDADDLDALGDRSGRTTADCRLPRGPGERAHLDRAEVEIARTAMTWRGERRALEDEERLAVLLHELAHALGYPSHASVAPSLAAVDRDGLRSAARRVLAGRPVDSPSLGALYALPSGVRVGERRFDDASRLRFDELARLAEHEGWDGPIARVGDRQAWIFWRRRGDAPVVLIFPRYAEQVRSGRPLTARAGRAARALLDRSKQGA